MQRSLSQDSWETIISLFLVLPNAKFRSVNFLLKIRGFEMEMATNGASEKWKCPEKLNGNGVK
jgi:hypothetical protein